MNNNTGVVNSSYLSLNMVNNNYANYSNHHDQMVLMEKDYCKYEISDDHVVTEHVSSSSCSSLPCGTANDKISLRKSEKKIKKPKHAFQTRSQVDILDDGYRWRKYGQKAVKNNKFPRYLYLLENTD